MDELNITANWNDTQLGPGYYCLVDDEYVSPCEDEPCGHFDDATCIDLTQNGTLFDIDAWSEFLSDEFGLDYNNATHGYICLRSIEDICADNPCNGTDTCVDLTNNGTTWNETLWEEFLWDEHGHEGQSFKNGVSGIRISDTI